MSALRRVVDVPERVVVPPIFFDLETTGLGPGAVPFLVGLAGFGSDGSAWVQQWQLDEPGGERAMWLAVLQMLATRGRDAVLVTYNGASFDRTVVRLRLRRLGLWDHSLEQRFGQDHFDLLPVCRRLWGGTLANVRLVTLEREVLASVRVDDPSGAEIAALGQRWLAGARDAASCISVAAARRHNADDLLGLASLVQACAAAIETPASVAEALGVARHLGRSPGPPSAALAVLEAWRPAALGNPVTGVALLLVLVGLLRKAGDFERAHAVLEQICTHHHGHVVAATRLAMDCEHRLRRPDLALAWLRTVAAPCPRRLARLLRKQSDLPVPAPSPSVVVRPMLPAPTANGRALGPAPVAGETLPTQVAVARSSAPGVPGSWRARSDAPARRAPPV